MKQPKQKPWSATPRQSVRIGGSGIAFTYANSAIRKA
jgi:hypothetical protein